MLRAMVNEEPPFGASYWRDVAAARWIEHDAALNRALAPFGRVLLEVAEPKRGEAVMDVGCGGGSTTIELAHRVTPGGRVIGVDVSAPVLAHAQQSAPPALPITWVNADAATWASPQPVDLVFSRFGVMFFEDPRAAFLNLVNQLGDGGRLCVACWCTLAENPWIERCLAPLEGLVENPWPSPAGPGPLSLGRGDDLRAMLSGAGLETIELRRVEAPVVFSDTGLEAAVDFAVRAGPASRLLVDARDDVRQEARQRITTLLQHYQSGSVVSLPGTCWVASGTSRT